MISTNERLEIICKYKASTEGTRKASWKRRHPSQEDREGMKRQSP
jgi:hypothetical protein